MRHCIFRIHRERVRVHDERCARRRVQHLEHRARPVPRAHRSRRGGARIRKHKHEPVRAVQRDGSVGGAQRAERGERHERPRDGRRALGDEPRAVRLAARARGRRDARPDLHKVPQLAQRVLVAPHRCDGPERDRRRFDREPTHVAPRRRGFPDARRVRVPLGPRRVHLRLRPRKQPRRDEQSNEFEQAHTRDAPTRAQTGAGRLALLRRDEGLSAPRTSASASASASGLLRRQPLARVAQDGAHDLGLGRHNSSCATHASTSAANFGVPFFPTAASTVRHRVWTRAK